MELHYAFEREFDQHKLVPQRVFKTYSRLEGVAHYLRKRRNVGPVAVPVEERHFWIILLAAAITGTARKPVLKLVVVGPPAGSVPATVVKVNDMLARHFDRLEVGTTNHWSPIYAGHLQSLIRLHPKVTGWQQGHCPVLLRTRGKWVVRGEYNNELRVVQNKDHNERVDSIFNFWTGQAP